MLHKDALAGDIHSIINWVVANAVARLALAVVTGDLYKVCIQLDTGGIYLLTATTPTWQQVNTASSLPVGGTAGQVLAKINSADGNATWVTKNGPAFRAFRNTTTQAIATATYTKVQLNGETFDTDNCFDSAVNFRFTPNLAGYYHFSWIGSVTSSATITGVSTKLYKNGVAFSEGSFHPGVSTSARSASSDIVFMNGTTDFVELFQYANPGSINITNGSDQTYLSGIFIRP